MAQKAKVKVGSTGFEKSANATAPVTKLDKLPAKVIRRIDKWAVAAVTAKKVEVVRNVGTALELAQELGNPELDRSNGRAEIKGLPSGAQGLITKRAMFVEDRERGDDEKDDKRIFSAASISHFIQCGLYMHETYKRLPTAKDPKNGDMWREFRRIYRVGFSQWDKWKKGQIDSNGKDTDPKVRTKKEMAKVLSRWAKEKIDLFELTVLLRENLPAYTPNVITEHLVVLSKSKKK